MEKFTKLTSTMLPLPQCDVDTDQIIPATYLKVTNKDGLAEGLFARWCYQPDGSLDPDFALNQPQYQGAQVLVAGDNFGTGSSREHASWALLGRGFRAVVSTSFADIFRNNALKNGLLPIVVDEQTQQQLMSLASEDPNAQIEIDLSDQTLKLPDDRTVPFPIDSFSKICLLEGVDQLGYLLNHEPEIAAYEEKWDGDRFYERGLG
jgi:3-isopropylmalate/(R)-2-methylmalate dehydratase small subunit